MDKLLENLPSIFTLIGVIIVQIIGQRLERIKQDAAQKKVYVDAADGVRDDLMKQVEEANKRIDKKDEIIESLKARIQVLEDTNLQQKWDLKVQGYQIEQQKAQIAALEQALADIRLQLAQRSS